MRTSFPAIYTWMIFYLFMQAEIWVWLYTSVVMSLFTLTSRLCKGVRCTLLNRYSWLQVGNPGRSSLYVRIPVGECIALSKCLGHYFSLNKAHYAHAGSILSSSLTLLSATDDQVLQLISEPVCLTSTLKFLNLVVLGMKWYMSWTWKQFEASFVGREVN